MKGAGEGWIVVGGLESVMPCAAWQEAALGKGHARHFLVGYLGSHPHLLVVAVKVGFVQEQAELGSHGSVKVCRGRGVGRGGGGHCDTAPHNESMTKAYCFACCHRRRPVRSNNLLNPPGRPPTGAGPERQLQRGLGGGAAHHGHSHAHLG